MSRFQLNFKSLINYFLRGVFIIAPIFGTVYAIFKLFLLIDTPLQDVFYSIFHFRIYGLGIVSFTIIIILVGYFASNIFFNAILKKMEALLFKLPLVKEIYKALRDIFGAFVSDKKKFEKPVIAEVSQGIYRIGFITNENLSDITDLDVIAVYFPFSYAFTGELILIHPSKITPVKSGKVSDIMKYVISGGIIEKN